MSGGDSKNERDNKEYKLGYNAGRNGTGGAYTFTRQFVSETDIERAGRHDGEADRAKHGSQD